MPAHNRLVLAFAFCAAMAASSALAQQGGNVTSFHGKNPSAADIKNALIGKQAAPEGLLPEGGDFKAGNMRGVLPSTVPTAPTQATPAAATVPAPTPAPTPVTPAAVPAAPVAPQPVAGCPTGSNAVAIEVTFELNSARLDERARKTLEAVAEAMRAPELSKCRFQVEGHTDGRGTPQRNQTLSEQRAEAVREFLVKNSVEGGRLVAVGKGERYPLNTANPLADENRRVQFRIEH